jgi:hypothetical protein
MSHLHRYSLPPDFAAQIDAMLPGLTPAQRIRFDDLVSSDRIITDDGKPHAALEAWVKAVAG